MTFARLILAASVNEHMPNASNHHGLPDIEHARSLLKDYLDGVFCLLPAFPETALWSALSAVYQSEARLAADFDYWLVYMALAIASMGHSRSNTDSWYKDGVSWAAHALTYADNVLAPGHITQIQALVLLAAYSMLDPAHFDTWVLVGLTCRALVDFGYHQDPPKGQRPDKQTMDQRRKLFYCAYALDRCARYTWNDFSMLTCVDPVVWFMRVHSLLQMTLSACLFHGLV
jgi:hypothetical protein